MMNLQILLKNKITAFGKLVTINNKDTIELLNTNFKVTSYNYKLNNEQIMYVQDKIDMYSKDFAKVIERLNKDLNSRQAVISFDICGSFPNCVVTIQFIIRDFKLYTLVYSRSLDIDNKLYQDIDLARYYSNVIEKTFKVKLNYIQFYVGSLHYYV
jgi:thymidylate synthase